MDPEHAGLARLARRVCEGEVVFFIGAGFSLDAEGNHANLLLARLLVRFEAMCLALRLAARRRDQALAGRVRALQRSLRATFDLGPAAPQPARVLPLFVKAKPGKDPVGDYLKSLVPSYFPFNEWACAAFEQLLEGALDLVLSKSFDGQVDIDRREVWALQQLIARLEAALLRRVPRQRAWKAELQASTLDLPLWLDFRCHCQAHPAHRPERAPAGKLVFLDSMGFADTLSMDGAPMAQDLKLALDGAADRLSARHHALAWLAAEGLCPVLITTNFDLLLDGSLRLAGLQPCNPPEARWPRGAPQLFEGRRVELPRNRHYQGFARIAEARQFFSHAQTLDAAHLYKIHGCAEAFRVARGHPPPDRLKVLRAVLPSIVFTFREIQNWREDTWSRDHLNTLLRTKTLVFSGYSGADPVIHDTFRTIYEEMAAHRLSGGDSKALGVALPVDAAEPVETNATAFFIGARSAFHGVEILRAASMAGGMRNPPLATHANLLPIHFDAARGYPTLDELFTVLYHLCVRQVQEQALGSRLQHVYYQLTGRRCPASDVRAMRERFAELREEEARRLDQLFALQRAPSASERLEFHRLTSWTWHFSRGLMREYALAEQVLRPQQDMLAAQRAGALPWYCPLSEHPDWVAWGVVLELALRHAHEAGGVPGDALWAVPHGAPLLALRGDGALQGLAIELTGMRQVYLRALPRWLSARPAHRWLLRGETVPWWHDGDAKRPAGTPSAGELWRWAVVAKEARPAKAAAERAWLEAHVAPARAVRAEAMHG